MMRVMRRVAWTLLSAVAGVLFYELLWLRWLGGGWLTLPGGWNQVELVTVLMTAGTLTLTAAAVVIAALGLIGYAEIRTRAVEVARRTAEVAAREEAREAVETIVSRRVEEAVEAKLGPPDKVVNELAGELASRGSVSDDGEKVNDKGTET